MVSLLYRKVEKYWNPELKPWFHVITASLSTIERRNALVTKTRMTMMSGPEVCQDALLRFDHSYFKTRLIPKWIQTGMFLKLIMIMVMIIMVLTC